MLDIPASPPDVETCDVCGAPAVYALRVPDGRDEAVCLRHRSFLPVGAAGAEHLELRWGRWCSARWTVDDVVLAGLRLPCEVCGAPGDVIQGVENDGGRLDAVLCRACVAPVGAVRVQARWRRTGWSVPA